MVVFQKELHLELLKHLRPYCLCTSTITLCSKRYCCLSRAQAFFPTCTTFFLAKSAIQNYVPLPCSCTCVLQHSHPLLLLHKRGTRLVGYSFFLFSSLTLGEACFEQSFRTWERSGQVVLLCPGLQGWPFWDQMSEI